MIHIAPGHTTREEKQDIVMIPIYATQQGRLIKTSSPQSEHTRAGGMVETLVIQIETVDFTNIL